MQPFLRAYNPQIMKNILHHWIPPKVQTPRSTNKNSIPIINTNHASPFESHFFAIIITSLFIGIFRNYDYKFF